MATGIQALAALTHDTTDQRRHKRVDLRFKVRLFSLPRIHQVTADGGHSAALDALDEGGYTENLSLGGLGLRWLRNPTGSVPFAEGDPVVAEIQLPRAHRSLRCLGRIAWVRAEDARYVRAGVTFVGVDMEELGGLQAIMQEQP